MAQFHLHLFCICGGNICFRPPHLAMEWLHKGALQGNKRPRCGCPAADSTPSGTTLSPASETKRYPYVGPPGPNRGSKGSAPPHGQPRLVVSTPRNDANAHLDLSLGPKTAVPPHFGLTWGSFDPSTMGPKRVQNQSNGIESMGLPGPPGLLTHILDCFRAT